MQRFILRKYVLAKNIKEAIRKDKTTEVADCWVDEKWQDLEDERVKIGFHG